MTPPDEPAPTEIVRSPVTAAAIGLVSGGISAFFGIGSGLVMAPALALFLRIRPARATGTSLAIVLPIAITALVRYQTAVVRTHPTGAGHLLTTFAGALSSAYPVSFAAVLLLALGSVVGAGLVRGRAAGNVRTGMGMLLVILGAVLWRHPFWLPPAGVYDITGSDSVKLLAAGCASGVVTSFLGAGGGVVLVPVLVLALGFPQYLAEATSLGVITVATLFGAVAHAARGNVIWSLAFPLALGGMLAAWLVMGWALQVPEALLRGAFGALLAAVGAGMGFSRARRQRVRSAEE